MSLIDDYFWRDVMDQDALDAQNLERLIQDIHRVYPDEDKIRSLIRDFPGTLSSSDLEKIRRETGVSISF
ncbi:MAG: hypothetical protein KBT48_09835 [Firmicutes bacterium]|nr:hypothetical protein [Bacillota bacterium]